MSVILFDKLLKMNGEKKMTGAKPKCKANKETVNHSESKKFRPHLPENVALQSLEKGTLLKVCNDSNT